MNEKKNTYLLLIAIFPVLDIGIAYFLSTKNPIYFQLSRKREKGGA